MNEVTHSEHRCVADCFEELWREKIAQEIEAAGVKLKDEAREISADAYLVTNRTTMACAAIARGKAE